MYIGSRALSGILIYLPKIPNPLNELELRVKLLLDGYRLTMT